MTIKIKTIGAWEKVTVNTKAEQDTYVAGMVERGVFMAHVTRRAPSLRPRSTFAATERAALRQMRAEIAAEEKLAKEKK